MGTTKYKWSHDTSVCLQLCYRVHTLYTCKRYTANAIVFYSGGVGLHSAVQLAPSGFMSSATASKAHVSDLDRWFLHFLPRG